LKEKLDNYNLSNSKSKNAIYALGGSMKKKRLPLIFLIIMILSGLLNALTVADRIRLVDILVLFFTGFGAGAGLVKAIIDFRLERKTKI
jgi:hypothetical membrane protein